MIKNIIFDLSEVIISGYHNIEFVVAKHTDIKAEEFLNRKKETINMFLEAMRGKYTEDEYIEALIENANWNVNKEVIKSNPFKLINGPKKPIKLPNYMKYSEFEALIAACDDTDLGIRNIALLELLLATGARIGQLINIKVKDIDFTKREVKVLGKGNKERICYFNEHAEISLKEYINNSRNNLLKNKTSEYLLINHIGNKLTDRGVRSIIDSIIKKSSLNTKVTPHTFRHTFATMLLNEGCDLKSVQELLGHVNLSTTSIYTHVTNDRIKDIYLHTHPRSKK